MIAEHRELNGPAFALVVVPGRGRSGFEKRHTHTRP